MSAVRAALVNEEHELPAGALPLRSLRAHHAIEDALHQVAGRAFELRRADRRDRLPVVMTLQAEGAAFLVRTFFKSSLFK